MLVGDEKHQYVITIFSKPIREGMRCVNLLPEDAEQRKE